MNSSLAQILDAENIDSKPNIEATVFSFNSDNEFRITDGESTIDFNKP